MKNLAKQSSLSCLVLFLVINIPPASLKATDILVIPFTLVHRLIAIEARINNVEGTFLLDTGAPHLLLNQQYFDVESLPSRGDWAGMNGTVKSVYYQKIDSLQLQSLTIPNLEANFMDLSHIEKRRNIRLIGIIGFDVLKDFEVFLDYPSRRIILNRLDKKGKGMEPSTIYGEVQDSLDFQLIKHLIVLKTQVNGVPLRMALDTGSEQNLLDRLVKKKVLENVEIKNTMNLIGSSPEMVQVQVGALHHLKCGNEEIPSMRTLITNLDHMRKSLGIWLDGLLGHEFLKGRRTLINYQRQKIYFFDDNNPAFYASSTPDSAGN